MSDRTLGNISNDNAAYLQGIPVSSSVPASGDVLQFNSTNFDWEPKPVSALPSVQSLQNIGTGQGHVWSNTTAGVASLKSLKQGSNILITENGSEINIAATNALPSGAPGDLLFVNNSSVPTFGKTIDGNSLEYEFQNANFQVVNNNNLLDSIINCGVDGSTSTRNAIISLSDTSNDDGYSFVYNQVSRNLALNQGNGAVGKDFQINCNTGNLIVNNKLKLPTVTANAIMKTDGSNVVTAGTVSLDDLFDVVISSPITNQVLTFTGAGYWANQNASSGTVTSVGLTMPSTFTVTGSPVTSSGTLAVSYASQLANRVLASPNGSSGTPTFRSLVSADIPTLAYLTSFNGRTGPAILPAVNDYNITQLAGVSISSPSASQILTYNGTNWVNSNAGVDINIYNSNGTLTGSRTVFGSSNFLTFNGCDLVVQGLDYGTPLNQTLANDCFLSYNIANGRVRTMYAMSNTQSYKTFIPNPSAVADWVEFYTRTFDANMSVNIRVTFAMRGTNNSTSVIWNVLGSIDAPQLVWLNVPPLSSNQNQGNVYNLEAYYNANTVKLRIIKAFYNGSGTTQLPYIFIQDNSTPNGTASVAQTTGSSGTFATAYYPAARRVIQTNNSTGGTPSFLFNWVPGYQISIEGFMSGGGGSAGVQSVNVRINGFIVAVMRGMNTSSNGMVYLSPTSINILNGGIITTGTNTLSFDSAPYSNNQAYSFSIIQTQ